MIEEIGIGLQVLGAVTLWILIGYLSAKYCIWLIDDNGLDEDFIILGMLFAPLMFVFSIIITLIEIIIYPFNLKQKVDEIERKVSKIETRLSRRRK